MDTIRPRNKKSTSGTILKRLKKDQSLIHTNGQYVALEKDFMFLMYKC